MYKTGPAKTNTDTQIPVNKSMRAKQSLCTVLLLNSNINTSTLGLTSVNILQTSQTNSELVQHMQPSQSITWLILTKSITKVNINCNHKQQPKQQYKSSTSTWKNWSKFNTWYGEAFHNIQPRNSSIWFYISKARTAEFSWKSKLPVLQPR